jgi:hypothetical protein
MLLLVGPARQHSIFHHISDGNMHEVSVLDLLIPQAGSFNVMGQGLHRFRSLVRPASSASILYRSGQSQSGLSPCYSRAVDKVIIFFFVSDWFKWFH